MNFAAQFFYSSYMSDRLERLSSPQTDCVENDPFWQRWETAADPESPDPESPDPESPDPDSPHRKSPANPLAAALTPNLPKDNLPLPLNLEEQQNPTLVSGLTHLPPSLSPCPPAPSPPPPPDLPSPSPCFLTQEQPSGATSSSAVLQPLPPSPLPRANANHTGDPSDADLVTQTTNTTSGLCSGTPALRCVQESKHLSGDRITPQHRGVSAPSRARSRTPSLPAKPAHRVASTTPAVPSIRQASLSSTNPCPSLVSPPASVGGLFHALVSFLLRLVLSFILLILPSEELRMGPHQPQGPNKGGNPGVSIGAAGRRRPTLIEPERLKDFGEEDLVGGDVRVWEAPRVSGPPEVQLMDPPKTRRLSEFKAQAEPSADYLRFEDISAAAFKIQSAIQKTPCTYSRLSKQYGMEIYLKKEHLLYTGSVKERGVLYLLSSLTQEQQKKGVIVATDCNFSMAVAHHAVELRIPVFAIMPARSSPPRLRLYRDYGAMVISYGTAAQDARNHARHLAKDNGYLYLEEDEQEAYLAGLGTVGMEIYEQVPKLDAVVVPACGQFGLLAGTAAALKHLNPRILVVGVEPEAYPLLLQSLKTGEPFKDMTSRPNSKLYGDLAEHSLGPHSFQLAKKHVDKVVTVSEENSLVAMLRFQEFERSTVDTEGAMGLAAILAGQLPELRGKKVAVVVSSANMELELVRQCVERALVLDGRISKFTVELGSLPGDMAKLLDFLSREDVRLLDVCHRRHSDKTELFRTQVECVVETRDKTQSMQLRKTLCERYPSLCWLDR